MALTDAEDRIYDLIKIGIPIKDVAKQTKCSMHDIAENIAMVIEKGYPVCFENFGVPSGMVDEIENFILQNDSIIPGAKELHQKLKKNWAVCYLSLAIIKLRYGVAHVFKFKPKKGKPKKPLQDCTNTR